MSLSDTFSVASHIDSFSFERRSKTFRGTRTLNVLKITILFTIIVSNNVLSL